MPINWIRNITLIIIFSLVGVNAHTAQAEGNGLLIGETRLHLGIGLEGGYDTNVNYQASRYSMADAEMNVKPVLELKTPEKAVSFELGSGLNIIKYFGIDNPKSSDYSTLNADANMRLTFNPKGQISFVILDIFSRNNDPRSDTIGNFNRTANSSGAELNYIPSGGAFEMGLGYKFYFELYDKDTGLTFMDAISHQPELKIKWKFFPKTAFVLESSMDMRSYPNKKTVGNTTIQNQDQMGIRAMAGLMGLMTPRLSTTLKVGYGDTFANQGDNYRSVIGKFELTYDFNVQSRASLGYSRDFQPASLYGYYGVDKVYAKLSYLLAGRLLLNIDGSFSYELFGKPLVSDSSIIGNTDLVFELNASLEFMINRMLSAGISEMFLNRQSNRKDVMNEDISYNKSLSLFFIKFYY
ncbi:MAG: hypothetical protein ACP5QK_03165 [Myxococcota bacterium]